MTSVSFYASLLIFNFLLYFIVILILFCKKKFTSISIRSPTLLILNNLSGWVLTSILILDSSRKSSPDNTISSFIFKYISYLYYPFQSLMILAFLMRCLRVIKCHTISQNEYTKSNTFINKRDTYMEKHYIKLMFLLFGIIVVLLTISNIIMYNKCQCHLEPAIFTDIEHISIVNTYVWICVSFAENFVLFTFCYLTTVRDIQQKIQHEIFGYTVFWVAISYYISAMDFRLIEKNDDHKYLLVICLLLFYACLVLNGILPIVLSCKKTFEISYCFHSKLMDNFYLFLNNEDCYEVFSFYLERKPEEFFLRLYTHIMKFKMEIELKSTNINYEEEINQMISLYFTRINDRDKEFQLIAEKIRNEKNNLNKETNIQIYYGLFDEALKYSYDVLYKCFTQFKHSEQFKHVSNDLDEFSYIRCKMINTGLIGKY